VQLRQQQQQQFADELYVAAQCAPGHTGPLCGTCDHGFWSRSAGQCRPCASALTAAGYVVAQALALLALLCFNLYQAFLTLLPFVLLATLALPALCALLVVLGAVANS
jgi:hypothetical protein